MEAGFCGDTLSERLSISNGKTVVMMTGKNTYGIALPIFLLTIDTHERSTSYRHKDELTNPSAIQTFCFHSPQNTTQTSDCIARNTQCSGWRSLGPSLECTTLLFVHIPISLLTDLSKFE
jgi:hypothetical protein